MTPINIQHFAKLPRTTLAGIPDGFRAWAESVHGWTSDALLQLGRANHVQGNALDYFVGLYQWLSSSQHRCCSCCAETAPHTVYGGLLHYCDSDLAYAERDMTAMLKEDALIAAGSRDPRG
jgi:hypothetical protein